jgi:hypothetical protein
VLLDTMVHEFNLLRGVLGEPTEVRFASLRAATVTVVLDFGGVECVVTWLDLPGIARYEMEACFYDPVGRVRLAFPSPYLKNTPAVLEMTSGDLAGPSSVLTSEVVSYEEPFKLELVASSTGRPSAGQTRSRPVSTGSGTWRSARRWSPARDRGGRCRDPPISV